MVKIYQKQKTIGEILIGFVCLITFLWSISFFSIYTREQTRITASKWIYQNIPQNSKILTEHWDDGLPITLNRHHALYRTKQLAIYEPDNEAKINYYAERLASADYLILSSRRLYGTLIHLPEKYPVTSRYYQLLFGGRLGYQEVVQFTSYPSILGVEINDDESEESFQVYDHPKVLIFENKQRLSFMEIKKHLK